jgi:hypothetical protein
MAATLVELIPLILGAVLAPLWVIIVLLMLASPQGLAKAVAFVLGMTLVRLIQGVLFGFVFGADPDSADAGPGLIAATLKMMVGILLLITAYRKWSKDVDPDEPPPQWMQRIDGLTPLKAFGFGVALVGVGVKLWAFTLSAIAVISAAALPPPGGTVAYLLYILFAQILLIGAILLAAIVPKASATTLRAATDWLVRYNRPITIVVATIFGIYFTWNGISGLLG